MTQIDELEREVANNGWRKYERLVLAEVKRGAEERAKMQADLQSSMGKMENKVEHAIEKSEARHEDAIASLGKEMKELKKTNVSMAYACLCHALVHCSQSSGSCVALALGGRCHGPIALQQSRDGRRRS